MAFLPAHPADLAARRMKPGDLDAIIVTGDAYVDHSSFGTAIIGRVLESAGYRVGVLARPDPDDVEAFRILGKPRLAWLITSGAVDSMVASYTANRKIRSEDEYAPGGRRELCMRADGSIGPGIKARRNVRPDRAVIAYTGMCRQAFKGVPVAIGGIEASLRRLSHYDYWSDTVRKSILLDSKADILVYGMGERAIVEIMSRLEECARPGGPDFDNTTLRGIRGTVWAAPASNGIADHTPYRDDAVLLPSHAGIAPDTPEGREAFARSFMAQYGNTDPWLAKTLVEDEGGRLAIQEPAAFPLERAEMDRVYALPYERAWHPMYEAFGGVPALAEVKFSLLSARGCFGACSFCSLTFHQGRKVISRSREAIVDEAKTLTRMPDFKGYIHDVGGPTANFRVAACAKMEKTGACADRRCLAPEPCANLRPDHRDYVALLRDLRQIPGVKKVFVRSGVRFDYAMRDPDDSFIGELVRYHVSGQLKVAPEHASDKVLALMGKPPHRVFDAFAAKYRALSAEAGLKQYLVPYFISGHPGSGLAEAIELAEYLRDSGLRPDQTQDFYPTPGTLATAMWRCGFNPLDGKPVYVAKGDHERGMQRALLQYWKPENRALAKEALAAAGRKDLIGSGPGCLLR
ncbi:MAG: YgiQ family radical SAM protein [Rectinemataceae bacterium]